MVKKLTVDMIWWRNVQPGEFYNIERRAQLDSGGGGSLYIEIPSSLVPGTLEFLDAVDTDVDSLPVITVDSAVVGAPELAGPIEFQRKSGGRMRIARQNRQSTNQSRHPAWRSDRGFPRAPDDVRTTDEARPYFPEGGLRIFVVKTTDGKYLAGFRTGDLPTGMSANDPMRALYGNGVGGLIYADRG